MQQTEFAAGYQSVKLLKDFIRPLQKTGNATEQNDREKIQGGISDFFLALVVGTFPKAFGKPFFVPCLRLGRRLPELYLT